MKVLRSTQVVSDTDVVLGQYTAREGAEEGTDAALGYLDDPTVPDGELFFQHFFSFF